MSNRRLVPGDVMPGVALPCDIFDASGRLVMRLGQIIAGEPQVARLLEAGIFGDPEWNHEFAVEDSVTTDASVFARTQRLRASMAATLGRIDLDVPSVRSHAAELMELCALGPDAALATVLLQRSSPFGVRQMVNAAIVTELLLSQRQPDASARTSIVCAALTMNIAMLSLQEVLYDQRGELSEQQRNEIRRHPQEAVERLRAAGLTDSIWLSVVGQHHEAIDGSGYPARVMGDAILQGAQFVGASDRYCAMVSERGYRPGAFPNGALKQIFLAQGKSVDTTVAALMVKEIGLYPPGTVVQLANGEIAMSMKRTSKSGNPVVRSILSASGIRLPTMPKRSTSQPSFQITQVHPLTRLPDRLDLAAIWLPRETDVDDEVDV